MKRPTILAALIVFATAWNARAADYRVEVIDSPAPADELATEIAEALSPTGIRVVRGSNRAVWEFWPCRSWELQPGFQATFEVLYPFQPGQLIGVLRLPRRANDFRDQPIAGGVYTLRYAQQPVDGNHVGTSPTRDFLLLVRADADQSVAQMDTEDLNTASAEAAESTHPAMLCLQRPPRSAAAGARDAAELPSIRHDEERDWWIVGFAGEAADEGNPRNVVVEVVAVGHAAE